MPYRSAVRRSRAPGHARLLPHARHQRRDDQRDRQHHHESEQILDVGDLEREARRNEEQIQCSDIQDGRQYRRATSESQARNRHAEQIHHCHIGELEVRPHQPGDHGTHGGDDQGPHVALPADGLGAVHRSGCRDPSRSGQRRVRCRDRDDIESARVANELGRRRRPYPGAPATTFRGSNDQARRIAGLRVLDQRRRRRRPVERDAFGAQRLGEAQQIHSPVALGFGEP